MPMRPAMSAMEAADIELVAADDAGLEVALDFPGEVRAGVPTTATVTVRHAGSGAPVEDLTRTHQVWLHLIVTSADLSSFAHLHPTPTGQPGRFTVDITFPSGGVYNIDSEFRQLGQLADVLHRQRVSVTGTTATPVPLEPSPRTQVIDGVEVSLLGDPVAGARSEFTLTFADAATGRPITDLQPYLGAAGHVVILNADAVTFAHRHAEKEDADGNAVLALPAERFGPELGLHVRFAGPGLYRLWAQFRLGNGEVVTAPFTVRVEPPTRPVVVPAGPR